MKVVGLIPARKNSKRLPEKNWSEVGGVSLWIHAVNHARNSGLCNPIAISSDDERIFVGAAMMSVEPIILIKQPQFEQTYDVMVQVMKHADDELIKLGCDADAICLLQPTSPLRTAIDVAQCIDMLTAGVDSVVSVTEGEDDIAFHRRHAGRLEHIPDIVRPNGAVYVIKTSVLRGGGHWYGPYAYSYVMPKERSIDIDNGMDLEMAQVAWERLYGNERASTKSSKGRG